MNDVHTKLAEDVDFTIIRYAQCWEDADVMMQALQIQPGDVCLSIASAGDNTLSLLVGNPSKVIAIDLSASQLACLELRTAAYRNLDHSELLQLMGARPSQNRKQLYGQLAPELSTASREVWDANPDGIEMGIGMAGRFERYLDLIRRFAVNPTHSPRERGDLFISRVPAERKRFYDNHWNNWRWRLLIRVACSRFVMGRLGRDPRFFKYAEGSVADHIMFMAQHAMVDLDPSDNAYLHWIVHGSYGNTLPHALRMENFATIRDNLDRLEWHLADVQTFLEGAPAESIHRFNFSDVFEYLSQADSDQVFEQVARAGCSGSRLAYWNMLVPRHRPDSLKGHIRRHPELSRELHRAARTFFYTDFVVEELI